MEEMLNKLELMLIGLRQMKTTVVFTWFPKVDKEELLKAIKESPKFKIEGNMVTLKSETEIYEEELQKDILSELLNEEKEDDILKGYDDDIELLEIPLEEVTPKTLEEKDDNLWSEVQDLANSVEVDIIEEDIVEEVAPIEEINIIEEIIEDDIILEETVIEEAVIEDSVIECGLEEAAASIVKEEVEQEVEQVIEKVLVKDTSTLNGSEIKYDELVRLIREYSANTLNKLSLTEAHKFDMQEKAIITFYSSKYNVKIKERNFYGSDTNIYALVHKKRGMEVGYLVICNNLNDEILNYMLDNYDDEVVYFCPLVGSDVQFEVGLNEFFLKDTGIILDKYLEHYEIEDECDFNIKKVEVVIGR